MGSTSPQFDRCMMGSNVDYTLLIAVGSDHFETHTRTHARTYAHAHAHTHTRTQRHAYTHAHTHARTHTVRQITGKCRWRIIAFKLYLYNRNVHDRVKGPLESIGKQRQQRLRQVDNQSLSGLAIYNLTLYTVIQ